MKQLRKPFKYSRLPDIERNQAERVLLKFGGAARLAEIFREMGINRDASAIYRWTYPKDKRGTGGIVPSSAWEDIMAAAKHDRIILDEEDWDPRPLLCRNPVFD